ncbi:MAG: GFA family protein [Maritimibacter sp.]|nr:GFA family protein [Maritimibacter sp.]
MNMDLLDETPREGGCQCGAVRFAARGILDNPHVCHCRMCQRATGNFFAPLVGVPNDRLDWTGTAPAVFESSEGHDRGFCAACGTPLFYRRSDGRHTSLMIGCFDDPASIPLLYEFGMESRRAQLDVLGTVEAWTTEALMPEEAARIRATNRQFRPDGAD